MNFLPSQRSQVPLIGKRSTTWRRKAGGQETHQVRACCCLSPTAGDACALHSAPPPPPPPHPPHPPQPTVRTAARCFPPRGRPTLTHPAHVRLVQPGTPPRPPPGLQVTGYEVRRVAPLPAPNPPLEIMQLDIGGADNSSLHTREEHPFSGAKQLATLAGLGGTLDGIYAVVAAPPGSRTLKVKLPKLEEAAAAEVQAAVAGRGATVRRAAGPRFPHSASVLAILAAASAACCKCLAHSAKLCVPVACPPGPVRKAPAGCVRALPTSHPAPLHPFHC